MPTPRITLTTDFGLLDHYVGVMKGVIATIAPDASVVDITHDIPPFMISEGAYVVGQTYPYFPAGTVHVAVVDPGVGSNRRAILLEAAGQFFVGPDNGVFSFVLSRADWRCRELNQERFFRPAVSATFHGRDIFAPVAAHLAAGAPPAELGPVIDNPYQLSLAKPVRAARRIWMGTVLKVDRFGNLITNFPAADFSELSQTPFRMTVGLSQVDYLTPNYAVAPIGEPVLIAGSAGFYEVIANQASAAKILGVGSGTPLELTIGG